jgi:hypothetical protein
VAEAIQRWGGELVDAETASETARPARAKAGAKPR